MSQKLGYELLKKRFGDEYARRIKKAYEGKETITSIAKDYGISRQAVSSTIIKYLGYKKRANTIQRETIINRFIDSKIKRFPKLKRFLNELRKALLAIENGELKKINKRTAFVIYNNDNEKPFFFRFRSFLCSSSLIVLWTPNERHTGNYIIISPLGIAIKYLNKGYASVKNYEFVMKKDEIIKLLKEF